MNTTEKNNALSVLICFHLNDSKGFGNLINKATKINCRKKCNSSHLL